MPTRDAPKRHVVYEDDLLIMEGKALGTASPYELTIDSSEKLGDVTPEQVANARKKGQTVGKRKLKRIKKEVYPALMASIGAFQAGRIDAEEFREAVVTTMKDAWNKVYMAGLRAGGVPGEGAGKGKPLIDLSDHDKMWIKSAMQHEMRFLNKYIEAVVTGNYKMPLDRRTRMYVDALESFYDSARVMGLPQNVLIWWSGPNDKVTCPSCRYMFENSPYTKLLLPTTPRSGLTICLTNCRDKLMIRVASPEQIEQVAEEAATTRGGHITRLRKIKRTGHL
jgi:hypothetical protein